MPDLSSSATPALVRCTYAFPGSWPRWCRLDPEAALSEFLEQLQDVAGSAHPEAVVRASFSPGESSPDSPVRVAIRRNVIELGLPAPFFRDEGVHVARAHRLIPVLVILACVARDQGGGTTSFTLGLLDDNPNADVGFCDRGGRSILIPDPDFIRSSGYAQFKREVAADWTDWTARSARFVWRGSTTGVPRPPGTFRSNTEWYRILPRTEICARLRDEPWCRSCDVGISTVVQIEDASVVERIERELKREFVPRGRQIGFRHHVDIDGNTNAWTGLMQALIMGGCVAKVASPLGFRQWYYGELEPWRHHVPIRSDLSDLEEAVDWCLGHEAGAKAIAAEGLALSARLTFDREVEAAARRIVAAFTSG